MGMLSYFYTGDTDAVMTMLGALAQGRAVAADDALVHADFSLKLRSEDLDSLSRQLHRIVGSEPVGLFDSIDDHLDAGPGKDYGIHVMRDAWVKTVAAVPDAQVEDQAAVWFQAMAEETGEPLGPPSPEAIAAIQELLAVCRKAVAAETPVVFYWSL